jgi:hypothetical protein
MPRILPGNTIRCNRLTGLKLDNGAVREGSEYAIDGQQWFRIEAQVEQPLKLLDTGVSISTANDDAWLRLAAGCMRLVPSLDVGNADETGA